MRRINQVAKIDHLREALAEPGEKLEAWRAARDEMQQNGLKLGKEFREGDDATKRKVVSRTCDRVLLVDGKPRLQLRSPFILRLPQVDLQSGLELRQSLAS